jgi:hypothetical protein
MSMKTAQQYMSVINGAQVRCLAFGESDCVYPVDSDEKELGSFASTLRSAIRCQVFVRLIHYHNGLIWVKSLEPKRHSVAPSFISMASWAERSLSLTGDVEGRLKVGSVHTCSHDRFAPGFAFS